MNATLPPPADEDDPAALVRKKKCWHGIAFQARSRGRLAPQSCGEKAETLGLTGLSDNAVPPVIRNKI